MSKSKKLLSMLLAMIMVFSTFAVGASAAYADYKDDAITKYDSIDKPVFTTEQLASIALDAIDGLLADLETNSFKIPVLNVTLNFSSIDVALDSLEDIYNGGVWNTAVAIAGDVGKELSFASLNTNPDGNFAANGCRRTTPGKSDLDVLYSVLGFLNDNANLLAKYGYGTLDLGPTLTGLLGDSVAEYLDAPNLIRGLLYDLAYDDDAPDYVEYEDLAVKPTIDQMLQIIIDDLLIDLEDELEESFEYGITYDFSNLIDIDEGSFYDQFESVLQYAYNNFLVPWGNTKIKEWIYDLAQAEYDESQKIYRYEYDGDGNQVFNEDGTPVLVKVGYYMDDSAAFTSLRKAPYIYDASAKSVYEANMENGTFNELADVINLNYVIPTHNFQPGEQFFTNFNNILKEWLDVMVTAKSPELVWEAGSNDMIITNLFNNAKKLLKVYGERFLGEYITIPEDEVIDSFATLEDAVIFFGKDAIARYADNIILPDTANSVRSILAYALCELIADLVPEENVYAKLQSGELNPETDEGWQAVLAIVARYYANAYTNMDIPAGLGFDATISHAVDWALQNYGGILYYTSQIDPNLTAWQKLDDVLFTLIPLNWLPENLRVVNDDGVVEDAKVTGSQFILIDFIIGNILDLKIEHIFDIFDRNASGTLNNTMSNVLIGLVTNILNAIIPGAIPQGLANFDSIATNQTLGDIIKGLLTGLYSVRQNLIPGALPLVSMILGLTGDQELEDPSIEYDDVIISATRTLAGTEFVVRNNSTGVNTGYTDKNGDFHQDALYQIKIKSITTNNSAVNVTYTANTLLNGGESKTFPVTGSLSADGLVRFAVTYEILDESGKSLTAEPITTYQFTYVASQVSDEDADAISYEMQQTANGLEAFPIVWVDGYGDEGGVNNHYIANAPAAFIGSSEGWGAIGDLSFDYGRTTVDENAAQNKDATTTFVKFETTAEGVLVADAGFQPITTQYGGYFGSIDFFDVVVPQVTLTDSQGNEYQEDMPLADCAGVYDFATTFNVTETWDGMDPVQFTVGRKLYVFNDYNLPNIVSSALGSNRQENNFASSGTFTYVEKDKDGNETTYTVNAANAWDNYLNALTAAQAIVLKPQRMETFDASVYEAAAQNLSRAIADLDACAEGAGVESLEQALLAMEGDNEGKVYTDDDYFFFADADYVLYTYNRYADHRSDIKSLINSQKVEEPGEDATEEEFKAYEEALANIPTLTLFEITYKGHMYTMNAERLLPKTVTADSKNYLNNAYNLINSKYNSELNPDDYTTASWEALETALAFARTVRADTDYANLKQSKINVARRELIQAYKGLTLKGAALADYAQLDEAILAAEAIFAEENYEEKYAGLEDLQAAYDEAIALARDLLAEDGQAIVDEIAALLNAALEALEQLEAGLKLLDTTELGGYADLEGTYGYSWTTVINEMMEPDYETDITYSYICGLVFDYYDGIESIVGTQGGASYEFEANANSGGALATGDKITLDDGTVYYLVLFGDATGDAMVDTNDISEASDMYNWANDNASANNAYFYGADVVRDDMIDINDIGSMSDMYNYTLDPYSVPQDGTFMG
ncbi:MAG: hypothetical protein IJA87_08550 [Clostridia bacterium]|nr:hypothetical protein [Clostridia bacterium]